MVRALTMNWRQILTGMCLIVTLNVTCINWLLAIYHTKSIEPQLTERLTVWSQCVILSGANAPKCEAIANDIIPVWRVWVQELFISLTGIESFLIDSSQR
jgi:hypothetical protein